MKKCVFDRINIINLRFYHDSYYHSSMKDNIFYRMNGYNRYITFNIIYG